MSMKSAPDRRTLLAGAAAAAALAACEKPAVKPLNTKPAASATVAVIGAGMAGSAAALHLARRGAKVTLFDQFEFGHERGSSHGATRLFRIAYFEHPNYVPILQRAHAMWKAFEIEAGEQLFFETGVLEAGHPDGGFMKGLAKAVADHNLPVPQLDAAQIARDHPQLRLPSEFVAWFEREAGFVMAGKTVAHQIRLAKEAGASLRPSTAVMGWSPVADGVTVETTAGAERFDRLVIAAGAWANGLIGLPVADVKPWPRTLFWRRPQTDEFKLGAFACFAVEQTDGRFFYGFPAIDDQGVKVAEHSGGSAIQRPEDRGNAAAPGENEAIDMFLEATIPALAHQPGSFQRCLYEVSPDHDFMIDRHPLSDRVVFAAGLSGHGFKFSPVLGEALATMTLDDQTPEHFKFLSLQRFS
ncbi:MAG: N-methyl-L-tryptophan oxidase [Parvularculaceae bacterium]|nr:N-methyl-L-tryptophan oxidase [Parvularculaceae bacterium]